MILHAIKRVFGTVAGSSLFGMMLLTFCDVVGRKFFDQSIPGSLEITELLMMILIFSALPLVTIDERHVMFDLLDTRLPQGMRALVYRLAHLACGGSVGFAAWLVVLRAQRVAEYNDTTANLQIPVAPFTWATAAFLAATAIVHLYLAARGSDGNSSAEVGA